MSQIIPCTEEAVTRGLIYPMQWPVVYGYSGYGCGIADLDNDGDQDIVIIGRSNGVVGVFENNGSGVFTDRSIGSGIPSLPQGSALAMADYDGDGLIDMYFTQINIANVLVRNIGGLQFQDVTQSAGVGNTGTSKGAHWGDYDGDGWLDLYVCNYTVPNNPGYSALPNALYHNLGNGTFVDVAAQMAVDHNGLSFQAVWFDMDRDGDLDLYLCNDRGHLVGLPNQLWRNDAGRLLNVTDACGAGWGLFAMGLACGDFDGNGLCDLYVTNLSGYPQGFNPLFLNTGAGNFIEYSAQAGVANWTTSWGCIYFDFDNNGCVDLYVNNQFSPNRLYLNSGAFPALNMAEPANVTGTYGASFYSFSSAVGDVNGDGALDLLLNNLHGNVQLFINHEGAQRRWIRYKVVGMWPNLNAIGANVDTRVGDRWQFREIYGAGNNYLGQNELIVHVGVGDAQFVDEVTVNWPGGGASRSLRTLPTNQQWTIYPLRDLGDANRDGTVDLQDFWAFAALFNAPITPGGEMMDFNGDSYIDLDDFGQFVRVYVGPLEDCDADGELDLLQILLSPSLDRNQDGQLDACACPADVNGDHMVNFDDLLSAIMAWGPCVGCSADVNGDGIVNFDDLLVMLFNWGSCE